MIQNLCNTKLIKENISSANIIDCIIYDLKNKIVNLNKCFNFNINLLYSFNSIKFNDLKEIIKAFNQNNFYLCISLLTDLKNKCIKYIKSFYAVI